MKLIKIDQCVQPPDLLCDATEEIEMTIQPSKSPIGLDGVPAAETALSHVDGHKGELIIAGERVADLVAKSSFEGVTARLWTAASEVPISEAEVRAALGEARARAYARLPQTASRTMQRFWAPCRSSSALWYSGQKASRPISPT
jgi:citrate synthase